ncbi:hypothetical protein [Xanthomonas nasturtii]|uniref:hypothetical protein n=1 Tax=Xanthomonas nasturtii TaxID=1843581 RepID=UPI0020137ABD|nr:hypothetical protein [Xanthomonas nasturtii]
MLAKDVQTDKRAGPVADMQRRHRCGFTGAFAIGDFISLFDRPKKVFARQSASVNDHTAIPCRPAV